MAETTDRLSAAARQVPTSAALRPWLDSAAAAGGRAAGRKGQSVSTVVTTGADGSLRLAFHGKGAQIARATALEHVKTNLASASQKLRADLIRALEG